MMTLLGAMVVLALAGSSDARTTRSEIKLSDAATRQLFSAADHTYKVHEKVPLYANKVGPFHNPSEVSSARTRGRRVVVTAVPDNTRGWGKKKNKK